MNEKIFGFIGCGNMGSALAAAARKNLSGPQVLLANRTEEKARRLADRLDAQAADNVTVAERADSLF